MEATETADATAVANKEYRQDIRFLIESVWCDTNVVLSIFISLKMKLHKNNAVFVLALLHFRPAPSTPRGHFSPRPGGSLHPVPVRE